MKMSLVMRSRMRQTKSDGKGSSTKKQHVPGRTCIACRQTGPKRELVRLVHTQKGDVEIDLRGKKAGRGAYLCKSRECWELALAKDRRNRLAHALKMELTGEHRAALSEYGKTLPSTAIVEERGIE